MAARGRYSGTCSAVVAVLKPHVVSPVWLKYGSIVDPTALSRHAKLIAELRSLQGNLSFTSLLIRKAFERMMEEVPALNTFERKEGEQTQWVTSMEERLRTMLRHAQQGLLKECSAAWCNDIRRHIEEQGGEIGEERDGKICEKRGGGEIDGEQDGKICEERGAGEIDEEQAGGEICEERAGEICEERGGVESCEERSPVSEEEAREIYRIILIWLLGDYLGRRDLRSLRATMHGWRSPIDAALSGRSDLIDELFETDEDLAGAGDVHNL